MIINTLDYTLGKNLIISLDSLKIENINLLSKTIIIVKESQIFTGSLSQAKLSLSNITPLIVPIIS
jgi:hypothetical protein